MDLIVNFIKDYIFIITFIVCFWFYMDCLKYKRFVVDIVERVLFIAFTCFLAVALNGQFNGV